MKCIITSEKLKDIFYVTLGSFVLAISINAIHLPNNIVSGGANGISIILNQTLKLSPVVVFYSINLPLLIICFFALGKEIGMKTIYGSLIYPFFVGVTSDIPVFTHNIFLASLFGGITTGIGLGLVFQGNASTGGTAIVSQIMNKYLRISLGMSLLLIDGLIIVLAMYIFDRDVLLFSILCLLTIGRVVDRIQVGFIRAKTIIIISSKYEPIKEQLLLRMNKGVTLIPMKSGYLNNNNMLLMTVIYEKDFRRIKDLIINIDPEAFFITQNATEVHGKGFSLKKVANSYVLNQINKI